MSPPFVVQQGTISAKWEGGKKPKKEISRNTLKEGNQRGQWREGRSSMDFAGFLQEGEDSETRRGGLRSGVLQMKGGGLLPQRIQGGELNKGLAPW